MRYYLIAGERSGDLHGGNLVKEIRKHDPAAQCRGVGGENMREAGVELSIHYGALAFMGFVEVARNFNTISRYRRQCKEDIVRYAPDVLILIDYGGFNMLMASFAKRRGIRVFYYITPKVWAWYQKRALRLKRTVDRMFVILPFEKDFFTRYDCNVDYVGNPVLDAVKGHRIDQNFLSRYGLNAGDEIVALLPGSRRQEVERIVPVMADVVKRFPQLKFAVAIVDDVDAASYLQLTSKDNVIPVREDSYNLLGRAAAAIVMSGTATLETALFKVPQVVVYKAGSATYWIVKMLIKVPFISLVNLIAGKEVVRELIQHRAEAAQISEELKKLLWDKSYRDRIVSDYEEIIQALDTGSASENAARLMVSYLNDHHSRKTDA